MVHQYKLNGYNIVLDTGSGAIHVVDDVAYEIIALFPTETEEYIFAPFSFVPVTNQMSDSLFES